MSDSARSVACSNRVLRSASSFALVMVVGLVGCARVEPQACVPGARQPCLGPGACVGFQACRADGVGFEACDCGGGQPGVVSACSCADSVLDGTESDVDCGGDACAPCVLGKRCNLDGDCASGACDGLTHLCAPPCQDQKQDEGESDVDCGGDVCAACADGSRCLVDTDCTSGACDSLTHHCLGDTCGDHHTNALETGVDCGGGVCPSCAVDAPCMHESDCASMACDGIRLVCVSDACADHRRDGAETDVDCGGSICPSCLVGQGCNSNLDCQGGHICNASKVCQ